MLPKTINSSSIKRINNFNFYLDIMKVYLRSGDKSFFLSCSEESDSHVNLTLYGQDENVLKIFCQELYTHLPGSF